MAATITFRPRPGIADALAARVESNGGDKSAVINAALAAYLNVVVPDDTHQAGTDESQERRDGKQPRGARSPGPRRARQAVPDPVGEAPPCPHPKQARRQLPYGTQCTECGQMLRR